MTFRKDDDKSLRAGIITSYEIPKSASTERVNELLFNFYKNDGYWKVIEKYYEKFNIPIRFGQFCAELYSTIDFCGLILLPYRQLFLWQECISSWDASLPQSDLKIQIQKIFLEGDKLFYIDERSYHSRNEALLVANTIITLAELALDEAWDLAKNHPGMFSKPNMKKEDIPSDFGRNLEMTITTAGKAICQGYLPQAKKSKVEKEVEKLARAIISTQ